MTHYLFRPDTSGFTLIEILLVVSIIGIASAIAVPTVGQAMQQYAVNNAGQSVIGVIRSARYTAVSKNKKLRVRFNCPGANAFRVVEVTATAADTSSTRCSETAYPYPDPNSAVAPDVDGPVMRLPARTAFGAFQDIEIDANGRLTPLTGCPACATAAGTATISVTYGALVKTIAVTGNGHVAIN